MRLPTGPILAASALLAGGAWYFRDSSNSLTLDHNELHTTTTTQGLTTATEVYGHAEGSPQGSTATADATESTRRALVVDNDQFYTGAIVGDGPLAKDTDDYGRKVVEMLSPEDATKLLRRNEESYLVNRGTGVVRYDVVQVASNDPIEDDHSEKIIEVTNAVAVSQDNASTTDWMFWGVFDGHSGWTTSAKLRQVLIGFAARELNSTYKAALTNTSSPFPSSEAVEHALKSAFVKLDDEICLDSVNKVLKSQSKRLAAELLAPALSGSCALLSFYDSRSKLFRVACTGDSRAVLGRRNTKSGLWYATPLSEDQTGSNPNEAARMRAEHPADEAQYVIRNGRVLGGLEPSRAFGDAFYKWSKETQDRMRKQFFGRTPHQHLKTPPYVTAEPVVTSTKIEPEKGDFVVLATDGLWEMLTNEEVVGLVGQWIDSQAAESDKGTKSSWLASWFNAKPTPASTLPVEKGGNSDRSGLIKDSKEDTPIRQQQWNLPKEKQHDAAQRFVVDDKNAATHLVRNALGGRDRDMVCALLTLPSPYSRRYR